jgi:hypothetical protein
MKVLAIISTILLVIQIIDFICYFNPKIRFIIQEMGYSVEKSRKRSYIFLLVLIIITIWLWKNL